MISAPATADTAIASRAVLRYDVAPGSTVELINRSENSTFLLTDAADGERSILRVHRPGYHRLQQIESELDWLSALQRDEVVAVPEVLPARDGRRVVSMAEDRHVVRFAFEPGEHPDEDALTPNDFRGLGRITAHLHQHVGKWRKPLTFDRFAWDWESSLGDRPRWGRWQNTAGVGAEEHDVLLRAQRQIQLSLTEYGCGPEQFGLIHADLRLANLLIHDGHTTVIDFDDCGFGWYLYDFAAAVSFIEHDPALPEWQAAWLEGYRAIAPLDEANEAMLPTLVLLRRLQLLAWMGTHDHAVESQTKLATYARDSCALAEAYLVARYPDAAGYTPGAIL